MLQRIRNISAMNKVTQNTVRTTTVVCGCKSLLAKIQTKPLGTGDENFKLR